MCQVWLHKYRDSLSPFKHGLIVTKVFHFDCISLYENVEEKCWPALMQRISKNPHVHVANKILKEYQRRKIDKYKTEDN